MKVTTNKLIGWHETISEIPEQFGGLEVETLLTKIENEIGRMVIQAEQERAKPAKKQVT